MKMWCLSFICILFNPFHHCLIVFIVKIFSSLVKYISKYFVFYDKTVNRTDISVSLSDNLLLEYRNVANICMLNLYPATLLNSLIRSNSFWVGFLELSIYIKSCQLQIEIILLLPFQFWCLLFIFLPWLLWLSFPILCWTSGNPCLIPDLREKSFKLFTTKYDVSCGSAIDDLYSVVVCFSCIYFFRLFVTSGCWKQSISCIDLVTCNIPESL